MTIDEVVQVVQALGEHGAQLVNATVEGSGGMRGHALRFEVQMTDETPFGPGELVIEFPEPRHGPRR